MVSVGWMSVMPWASYRGSSVEVITKGGSLKISEAFIFSKKSDSWKMEFLSININKEDRL